MPSKTGPFNPGVLKRMPFDSGHWHDGKMHNYSNGVRAPRASIRGTLVSTAGLSFDAGKHCERVNIKRMFEVALDYGKRRGASDPGYRRHKKHFLDLCGNEAYKYRPLLP